MQLSEAQIEKALSYGRGYRFCRSLELCERESESFIALAELANSGAEVTDSSTKRAVEQRLQGVQRRTNVISENEISVGSIHDLARLCEGKGIGERAFTEDNAPLLASSDDPLVAEAA